ncbi:YcjX family protein [Hyphomicrobium sp.]|uniref:YcjX family protein n=1 Tax=Hyphomicrobium sp. TaxID=82 RepID=UPI002C0C967D|nr:YcjX family protein [Hyphomicrobium sp.]HVZ06273.1 YcjX family protein [Hyphomicrobium sp.]
MADLTYSDLFRDAQMRLGDYLTPSVRLGVTGLSRAGKTIFITALVRNLISGGRLPFFAADAEHRIVRAYLEPQPDDSVPRFDYEAHLADLLSSPPAWPDSTRRISELRITIEYRSASLLKRVIGLSKLHLDIVDYPGEWLIDLPLLDQDYRAFSSEALALAAAPQRAKAAKPFLSFLAGTDPAAAEDEQIAMTGAKLFTEYLRGMRESGAQSTLAPGRFLLPGDLEGSPLLTFFPMPLSSEYRLPRGSLAAMMMRRFESYKTTVVKPFFNEHFARLDRQIVLVDVLTALNRGADAVADLERAMTAILKAFRPGANSWLSALLGRKIDRVLFAATKADHLPASSHDRLEAILKVIVDEAISRAETEGAGVGTLAVAALRATRETTAKHGNEVLPCLRGTPIKGETIGGVTFDGATEAAIFPGDLPIDPESALSAARSQNAISLELVRFAPPKLADTLADGRPTAFPHIRLDRALDFLISDYLA